MLSKMHRPVLKQKATPTHKQCESTARPAAVAKAIAKNTHRFLVMA